MAAAVRPRVAAAVAAAQADYDERISASRLSDEQSEAPPRRRYSVLTRDRMTDSCAAKRPPDVGSPLVVRRD